MVIFQNSDGSCQMITPSKVYQGSNNVDDITVVAPFAASTALQIGFVLPNGLYWESKDGARYVPMERVNQTVAPHLSAWHYTLTESVTEQMGELYVAFNAIATDGNMTSYMCKVLIEESVLPNLPTAPDPSVYELLQLYIARLDDRTKNVPNLVASIQPVASNAFTYTDNSGVESAPIVLAGGESAPIPYGAASTVAIPDTAWQAEYSGADTVGYTYKLTAAMHGQMRDDAEPSDLWVSADTVDGADLLGYFPRYTVDASGDITISVNEPIAMNVRVWNGKSIVDTTARDLITAETERAEAEEGKLQDQINELVSGNKDDVARNMVVAETARAEKAESELQANINAEVTRAETAEADLQKNINAEVNRATAAEAGLQITVEGLETQVSDMVSVVAFTAASWDETETSLYYLGAVNKSVEVPNGKRIVQVLDGNNEPRGTWRGNVIYANVAFAGVAIII